MSRPGVPFEEVKAEFMKDEKFAKEYERLAPRYEAIEQIIRARRDKKMDS